MLRIDPSLNHVPARREHVVALYESINQPLVNIPNHGAAPTAAYLLGTRNEHGYYTVFVYLHQPETRAVLLYVSEPRNLTAEQYRGEEAEAVRFVESMGFMIDSVHFRQLSAADQDSVMARVPVFRPPVSTLDLYEVADDGGAGHAMPSDVFGALGANADEMFRRAGLSGGGPQGQPIGQPMMGQMPMGPAAGMGHMAMGQMPMGGGMPGQPPMGAMSAQPQMGGMPAQPLGSIPAQPLGSIPGMGGPGSGQMAQARFGGPGTGPQANMGQFSPPTPGTGLVYAPNIAAGYPQGHPGLGGMVPQQGSQPPQLATQPPASAESLERLGRFLAAFGLLLAVSMSPALACKSAGTEVGVSPLQSQLDLGEQQLAERRFPEAIQTFEEVLKEEPKEKFALRGMGLAYNALGRKEQAESFYRRAMEQDPKWSEPKNELAGILIESRRCEEAETLLRQVAEDVFYATPEYGEHNLALALACSGKQDEAIAKLETLVLKRPLFCLGYLTLSQLSAQAKRAEVTVKACEDFAQHCAQNEKIKALVAPEHTAVCYLRSGMAYAQMGDVESARASFMRCQTNSSAVGKECERALEMLTK